MAWRSAGLGKRRFIMIRDKARSADGAVSTTVQDREGDEAF